MENLELTLNGNKERFRDEEFKRMGLLASLAVTLCFKRNKNKTIKKKSAPKFDDNKLTVACLYKKRISYYFNSYAKC